MDRATFEHRLRSAADEVLRFARVYVRQHLSDEIAFRVYPNQSYDGNPRVGDELVFPNESLPDGNFRGPWTMEKAVAYLSRDGQVPEWIDAAVESVIGERSIISLRCCGRFTGSDELLYHLSGGLAPFSIKSPVSRRGGRC